MSYDLVALVQSLGSPRVLVLGDLILDRYTWGDAERISPEAPVVLLRAGEHEVRLGGAANVANMLRGLGARVTLAGVVGADAEAQRLRLELDRAGVEHADVLADDTRPTTVKDRFIGQVNARHPHQMLRVDREVREPISPVLRQALLERITTLLPGHDVLLVSDYDKGVCVEPLLQALFDVARSIGVPVLVDPVRGASYRRYRRATAITPNRVEAQAAVGETIRQPADAVAAGLRLCHQHELQAAVVTLDKDGMALVHADGRGELFPTRPRQVYDITGAGDMVLATLGMCVAAGAALEDAVRLANVAGGLEVERVGCAIVTKDEILADLMAHGAGTRGRGTRKIATLDELEGLVASRRRLGQRVVFTNGCFDLLHPGHVAYLQQAAEEGDCLIVAVNGDRRVRELKGPERPIIAERDRAAMLAALECVDHVVVFQEDTPHRLLERLRPDVLVKGGTTADVVGREVVEAYGGEVKVLGAVPGVSTTQILERLNKPRAA